MATSLAHVGEAYTPAAVAVCPCIERQDRTAIYKSEMVPNSRNSMGCFVRLWIDLRFGEQIERGSLKTYVRFCQEEEGFWELSN